MDPLNALIAVVLVMIMMFTLVRFISYASRAFKNAFNAINDDDIDDSIICDDCYMYIADALDTQDNIDVKRKCSHCNTEFSLIATKK